MATTGSSGRFLQLVFAAVILYATVAIVLVYRDYFPPNFRSDFLLGRRRYFAGVYAWAFYAHIIAGPITLVSGLVLLSERFRNRWPRWHRLLGRSHVLIVLSVLVSSAPSAIRRFRIGTAQESCC